MLDQFLDGGVVADDDAVELPLVAEDFAQQEGVASGGDAVQGVEGGHEAGDSGFLRGEERREIDLAEQGFGDPGAVVIAAGFGGSIAGEVFGAGGHGIGGGERVALKAVNDGCANCGGQPGVFARAFGDAAPARVPGDIEHGREGPVDAFGGGLARRGAGGLADEVRIPTGGFAEGDGEDGAEAVDDVASEDQGDLKAALFHGDALGFGAVGRSAGVQERAPAAAADLFLYGGGDGDLHRGGLRHLAEFLFEGHSGDEAGDAAFYVL